ncbi:plasma membrane heme transmembrane transporter Str3 [Schizosaccharomyces pombe]|uniref:Low affinity heme transporter str3 n=1 Tax=Schizosaccharomyces pombe (strain 972 / ATCC 24843) TaxID=284812 RepID=STR3_SCHPO|nr:siderophore-Fe(3+) transporter Str3 [Schizosaccharomyces pombe]Q92341.1 RecName: Full=Low affinity heme transporter str3; AltName: Full=Siderophore iron transporter 3 [Schizosaccharomyces pombe 972h-]CAB03597.1 siderophore-iron transporter Str3 [Schizosaccharomyces pombe]|eukprot:NP_592792.1 siderophore-Fe(3+) transporter Str3 [Schizosaccharomyces pombe]
MEAKETHSISDHEVELQDAKPEEKSENGNFVFEKAFSSDEEKGSGYNTNETYSKMDNSLQHRGVSKIEAVRDSIYQNKRGMYLAYAFGIAILACSWASAIQSSTTYSYQVYATASFNRTSMISTLEIATAIISSVCKPILGKFSDITSRPMTYTLVLLFYVIGFIVVASSSTISAYVIGSVFISIGSSGLDYLNTLVVGDLTSLKWRGFMTALLSTPYIATVWFTGFIVQGIIDSNWRWGYGMFAIIMPAVMTPAVIILMYLERQANKDENIKKIINYQTEEKNKNKQSKWQKLWKAVLEVDLFGLILLGVGWSILLLPFSLTSYAKNGWKNPSMIAMMVVGGVILIAYSGYEMFIAPYPSCPRRVMNRTFITAVIIDFFYYLAGYLQSMYFTTYTWILYDWSYRDWTYFNNTMTIALCVFGVFAGAMHRVFHRYKYLQIIGLVIKIVGYGILIRPNFAATGKVDLAWSLILIGMGGSFSVVGSQVSCQASVPHQDLAIASSLLPLYTNIGGAIGAAIASPIFSNKVPKYLREYLPSSINDTQVYNFYSDSSLIREYPVGTEIRDGAIKAYSRSMFFLLVPAVSLSFIPLAAAFWQSNFYLGNQQNAVEGDQDHKKKGDKETTQEEKIII